MNTVFSNELFRRLPVVGILRGFTLQQVTETVRAAIRGGLTNIEITMNSPDAREQIRAAIQIAEGRANIGAGTVIAPRHLDDALAAGASFIVTPTLNPTVVAECVARKVPVFPGALSPTEILRAWELGATMVKIFPADNVGPSYLRAVKSPLPHVKLMPTGGVDLKTLADFVKAGADGFGVGNPLFDRKRIEAEDWNWVEGQCRAFAETYRSADILSAS